MINFRNLFQFDIPRGYTARDNGILTSNFSGEETQPAGKLDMLLPPNAEYLLGRLVNIQPLDNPTYRIGELQNFTTQNGSVYYREWDYRSDFDWDTFDVQKMSGLVGWCRARYVEAILPVDPFAFRLRISQSVGNNAKKGDNLEVIFNESMGNFKFLFSILNSIRLQTNNLDQIRSMVQKRNSIADIGMGEWFLRIYFGKEKPPVECPIPHFFTVHQTPVLEAIMNGLQCQFGRVYSGFYRLNDQGKYEHSIPEWDDFCCWNNPVNIPNFLNLYDINGRNIYINASFPSDRLSKLESELYIRTQQKYLTPEQIASGTISQGVGSLDTIDFYIEHIDEVGCVCFDLDDEMGDYLFCLFSPKNPALRERVRQCVEQSGYPTFTTDDINRTGYFPAF